MSKWNNPEEWRRLLSGEDCPICRQGRPTDIIATLASGWLTAGENVPLKGSCTLFFRRHAVELYELSDDEAKTFMGDVRRASRVIQQATGAVKMNYEVHGNTIPHLHMHLFPRYQGDPFEGQPINPRIVTGSAYAPGEFAEFAAQIRRLLE